jgi:nitrate/nitrite transporter NarK
MALGFLQGGLIVTFASPRIGALADRFGTPRIILAGAIAFVVGYALFLRIDASSTYGTVLLPTMVLIGIGFALCSARPASGWSRPTASTRGSRVRIGPTTRSRCPCGSQVATRARAAFG